MSKSSMITQTFKIQKGRKHGFEKNPKPSTSTDKIKQDPDDDMTILKQFDLNLDFGPCTGITRLQRWARADKHGLNPPVKVKDIISKHPNDPDYTECPQTCQNRTGIWVQMAHLSDSDNIKDPQIEDPRWCKSLNRKIDQTIKYMLYESLCEVQHLVQSFERISLWKDYDL